MNVFTSSRSSAQTLPGVQPVQPASGNAETPAHPTAEHKPVIAMINIVKRYQMGEHTVHALRGVDLLVERGDYVAIMGASGSGKSTLMNIIGCLDIPTSGRYHLDGVDVRLLDEARLSKARNRKIGFIFQSFNLIPRTSAVANVELPLACGGLNRKDRRARALAALAVVGLSDRALHMPNELSGGQQQRVAVARAIATSPALLLADEPTGNLDSTSTAEVLDVFKAMNDQGRTVVMITHEDEVAERAHRVIRLRDGEVIEDRRIKAIVGRPSVDNLRGSTREPAAISSFARPQASQS
jgi:putative ABC transport system ATP-binding protein